MITWLLRKKITIIYTAYMRKFYSTTTSLIDTEYLDLGIKPKEYVVNLTVDLSEITIFYEHLDDSEKINGTTIYLKSGESFVINDRYENFLNLLIAENGK